MCSAHAARVTCARISKRGELAGSFGPSTSKIKSPRSHISSFRSRTSTLPINVCNNTKFEDTLTLGNYRLKLHQAFVRGVLLHPRITIKPPVPSTHLTSNFIRWHFKFQADANISVKYLLITFKIPLIQIARASIIVEMYSVFFLLTMTTWVRVLGIHMQMR